MKKENKLKIIVYVMLIIFVLLLSYFIVLNEIETKRGLFIFAAVLAGIWLLLGGVLVFLAFRYKIKGKLKKFLILTGASACGFLIFSVLHNVFYALEIIFMDIIILKYLMEALHVASFLISVIGCPIGFLIGVVSSLWMFRKRK